MFKKALKFYLIGCGLLLNVGAVFGLYYALNYFSLTPQQFLVKLAEKSGVAPSFVVSALEPSARYSDHQFDGVFKTSHPRILLPELANLSTEERVAFFKNRERLYKSRSINAPGLPCKQNNLQAQAICWLATNDAQAFEKAISRLLNFLVETPDAAAQYGNGWQLALSYDLIASNSQISTTQHQQIQLKLEKALVEYLRILDDGSPSLWHGRLSLSSNAWLVASVLDVNSDKRKALVTRAQGHFLDSVQSVAITEAWPEGYNYWINNRAFYFSLAAAAYINGLTDSQHADQVKQLMARVGQWHIHATRPDNRIQGYGDEGPRTDLKDETRRVIDLIADITDSSLLANYSLYLQKLHGVESYYRGYRWGFHLFNDPELLNSYDRGSLADFSGQLENTELFGRNGSNSLYIRSGWDKNATYLTYQAGHSFTHHNHYAAGHFTLFKGAPLAINSSSYGDFSGENRLNYSIRTIAKNSLIIQRPGEKVKPNRFFNNSVSAGGQRITLPTGSSIQSTAHWQENLYKGQHLEGAELKQFTDHINYTYIQSDLTPAYNNTDYDENGSGGKIESAIRSLFYLKDEDILLVRDQVTTTDPDYRAKWLLHSLNKPETRSEKVLKGSSDNGILATNDNSVILRNKNSSLRINTLLPLNPTTHLVGGTSYRYYVETDGDDQTLDGKNMVDGNNDSPWFDSAFWRAEIFTQQPNHKQDFLVSLAPANQGLHPIEAKLLTSADNKQQGALLGNSAVLYTSSRGEVSLQLPNTVKTLYLIGTIHKPRSILVDGHAIQPFAQNDNITQLLLPSSQTEKTLQIKL